MNKKLTNYEAAKYVRKVFGLKLTESAIKRWQHLGYAGQHLPAQKHGQKLTTLSASDIERVVAGTARGR